MILVCATGTIVDEPKYATTSTGTPVVNMRLKSEEPVDGRTFTTTVNLVVWGKLAERVHEVISVGSYVSLYGDLKNRSYDGKDGQKKWTTEIRVSHIEGLAPKKEDEPAAQGDDDDLPF